MTPCRTRQPTLRFTSSAPTSPAPTKRPRRGPLGYWAWNAPGTSRADELMRHRSIVQLPWQRPGGSWLRIQSVIGVISARQQSRVPDGRGRGLHPLTGCHIAHQARRGGVPPNAGSRALTVRVPPVNQLARSGISEGAVSCQPACVASWWFFGAGGAADPRGRLGGGARRRRPWGQDIPRAVVVKRRCRVAVRVMLLVPRWWATLWPLRRSFAWRGSGAGCRRDGWRGPVGHRRAQRLWRGAGRSSGGLRRSA